MQIGQRKDKFSFFIYISRGSFWYTYYVSNANVFIGFVIVGGREGLAPLEQCSYTELDQTESQGDTAYYLPRARKVALEPSCSEPDSKCPQGLLQR